MKVLVTGAAGFVGSHCLRSLQAAGHDAVGFVRSETSLARLADLAGSVELAEVPLGDAARLSTAVRSVAPDAVIHAAWYAEPGRYLNDVDRNIESLGAGLALLRAALDAGVRRVVLVGSCLEAVDSTPESIYARTKRCLHEVGHSDAVLARASVVCAHVFSPYGPGDHPARALPSVIRAMLRGEPIAVGSGAAHRDYVHISDAANALVSLASCFEEGAAGGVDVCTGISVQLGDVFAMVAAGLGRADLLRWGAAEIGPGESFDAFGDPGVLESLGWRPKFDLEGGIRDSVAWWRAELAMPRGTR